MTDLGHTALGAWSGGVHMHFGLPLEHERLTSLLCPGDDIGTVITADVYGTGAADSTVGEALAGRPRESYRLVGMVGHDFYEGERAGAKGYPRFTDPALRGPDGYAAYLRMATERSLERCGADRFDVLMLHNPDHIGYSSPAVWEAMSALREDGLAGQLGVAPGPANGFTLDVIACLERFGDHIDWAMLILNPFEPWPGRLALPACQRADVRVIARVVDYGGVFWDDAPDEGAFPEHDHRSFRPAGWVDQARAKLDRIRPIAARHELTPLQLAAAWTLSQPAVACVAPTLIQEDGANAKPIEQKRIELAHAPAKRILSADELSEIDAVGDNTGCMALKGASPVHEGAPRPDAWPLDESLRSVAERWGIAPERDLVVHA
jgi:aryl-alcohol dehydrogenase-like predicted oxidoreductase